MDDQAKAQERITARGSASRMRARSEDSSRSARDEGRSVRSDESQTKETLDTVVVSNSAPALSTRPRAAGAIESFGLRVPLMGAALALATALLIRVLSHVAPSMAGHAEAVVSSIPKTTFAFGFAWAASLVAVRARRSRGNAPGSAPSGKGDELSVATDPRRLGPYVLEGRIASGGMGDVYLARHARLNRLAAIKMIRAQGGGVTDEARERFEREALLTSELTHPSTIQVYDFGSHEGNLYYAMEYVDGLTLTELVERDGPQPPGRVAVLIAQICGALAEAHAKGLLHRDVKPDNVLVSQRGLMFDSVKLVDFGLANLMRATQLDDARTTLGTPEYMAPECIVDSMRVDARSDIYAVGAIAYFLLTGTHLFDGSSEAVLFQQVHTHPEWPSTRLGSALPEDIEDLVLACLAKNPSARPSTAAHLQAHLLATESARRWTPDASRQWWENVGRALPRRASLRHHSAR